MSPSGENNSHSSRSSFPLTNISSNFRSTCCHQFGGKKILLVSKTAAGDHIYWLPLKQTITNRQQHSSVSITEIHTLSPLLGMCRKTHQPAFCNVSQTAFCCFGAIVCCLQNKHEKKNLTVAGSQDSQKQVKCLWSHDRRATAFLQNPFFFATMQQQTTVFKFVHFEEEETFFWWWWWLKTPA